jgi:hypothetical protein
VGLHIPWEGVAGSTKRSPSWERSRGPSRIERRGGA